MIDKDINKQIEEYIPLLKSIVNSYKRNYSYLLEDIYQTGLIALWNSLSTFNSAKEVPFEAFARTVIKNSINSFLKKESKINENTYNKSIDNIIENEKNESSIIGLSNNDESIVKNCEIRELEISIRTILDKEECKIITLLKEGYNKKEIAEILNYDKNKFNYIFKKLKNKIKEIIEE